MIHKILCVYIGVVMNNQNKFINPVILISIPFIVLAAILISTFGFIVGGFFLWCVLFVIYLIVS